MSNDPIEASTTSETEPTANYSRWMTDLETEISHLKLYQLAIPGAHNSGVDKSGTWGPWEDWGACQINSFPQQLAAGARFLDLRLLDDSYKKPPETTAPLLGFMRYSNSIMALPRQEGDWNTSSGT
ncbi:hypothetical protein SAMN04490202_2241 [Pseudomonas reinekei]|jgi:hypothetical protein|uniref:Uncharacterized protein n=1 Tax=Pseudomonas reinekei TaxID=395598 RepID=A0A1H0NF80_PSERE|nr:hypothetical protein [Pseudomonas reinekei]KAB0482601.1 hypothetical protein F7R15_23355 [Pseudomonas reinekei]SDO91412.1 hypothetical protein SAMN04490202_2241 [Pseudomonas reinekei]